MECQLDAAAFLNRALEQAQISRRHRARGHDPQTCQAQEHGGNENSAERRDRHAVCCAPRAARRPVPLRRRASDCGSAAALGSGFIPQYTPFHPPLNFLHSPTRGPRSSGPHLWHGLTSWSVTRMLEGLMSR